MILINNSYPKNHPSRELNLEIEDSMNRGMSLGIFVSNEEEYYTLMNLLKEKGFLWSDRTSPPYVSWSVGASFYGVPLLIILRNYKITRSSCESDSYAELDTVFNFSDFY